MKNSTVELMVRNQFNIPNDAVVKVKCRASTTEWYDFEIVWWCDDVRNECHCRLPHINYVSEQY